MACNNDCLCAECVGFRIRNETLPIKNDRLFLAGLAMHSIILGGGVNHKDMPKYAVKCADELLEELDKESEDLND